MTGDSLDHYDLGEKLGAGGMGEVYRARDTRLGREVAVKILPDGFARDQDRRARFEREARLLASLNHPNIAAIYGLGEAKGVHYLALEYVPGDTLRVPLPVEEALSVCQQVAQALEAAHEKGIVHRDLKPQNIVVTPEGKVKVLDFGLAKNTVELAGPSESDTLSGPITEAGLIMGTAAYMSPEQARGRPVDKRTDIWSFGCVLYEALAGVRAFARPSRSDAIAAILTAEPDPQALPARVPARVRELIRRCLQKDPAHRLRDIGDARLELEDAIRELAGGRVTTAATASPAPAGRSPRLLAAGLLTAAAVAAGYYARACATASRDVSLIQVHRLTDLVGLEEFPALSPDGKSVAFAAAVEGRRQIWVRLLAGGPPLQLTRDPTDHIGPRWSPDSTSILYYSPEEETGFGALFEIPALGGVPRRLAETRGEGDLSHDGKRIAFFRPVGNDMLALCVMARDGSAPRTVTQVKASYGYAFPRWSPDDRWIAFQQGQIFDYDIQVVASEGGEPRRVVHDRGLMSGFTWHSDSSGFVYSSSRGSTVLYLPSFNLWSAALQGGPPRQLTFGEASYVQPDVEAGRLVASRTYRTFDIWKFPVAGTPTENVRNAVRITQQTGHVETPSVAPGDRELVYLSESGGHGNLWALKLDGSGETRQITFESDAGSYMGVPVWSPDGRYIAYVVREREGWSVDLWVIRPDGTGRRKVDSAAGWAVWSGDGQWLYYGISKANVWQLWKAPADGGPPVQVRAENAQAPALSPDGRTLYYLVPLGDVGYSPIELRVGATSGGSSRLLTRIPGWRLPSWQILSLVMSPDGGEMAALLNDGPATNIWTISTADGGLRAVTDFGREPVFISRRVSWSSNGSHIYAAVGRGDADVVLLAGLSVTR